MWEKWTEGGLHEISSGPLRGRRIGRIRGLDRGGLDWTGFMDDSAF